MSKYAFSESFGDFAGKDAEDAVLTKYKKNVVDHILQHYEIHVNSHNRLDLTSSQLLYYHVYGDYRLVVETDTTTTPPTHKPKFQYRTSPVTEKRTLRKSLTFNEYYLNSFISTEQPNIINGIYDNVENDGAIKHSTGSIDWLNTELSKNGAGTRFNLPSIGTEIVKMHAYGNASDNIKKGLIDELYSLAMYVEEQNGSIPEIYTKDIDGADVSYLAIINPLVSKAFPPFNNFEPYNDEGEDPGSANPSISAVLAIFISELLSNKEYTDLSDLSTKVPLNTSIEAALHEVYSASNDFDTETAISKIASVLFATSSQKFDTNDRVVFSESIDIDKIEVLAGLFGSTSDDIIESQYTIRGYSSEGGYSISTIDLVGGGPEPVSLRDQPGDVKLENNDFVKIFTETVDFETASGDVINTGGGKNKKGKKKKSKGGSKVVDPILIVFQRILLDTMAAVQILFHTNEWARKTGDNADNKTEAKMRFLSRGVNVYASNKGNKNKNANQKDDKKDNKKQLKPIDVYDAFPNIAHFDSLKVIGIPPNVDSGDKDKLGNVGLLDELANWRAYYTLSILAKARKKTFNRDAMDKFYGSNILINEIAWMATALSDGTKVLKKKEDERSLMEQIQYRYVEGTPANVTQRADAPKETVFYEVDMPLLKEVIMTYTDVYNKSVIYRAFNTPVERKTITVETDDVKTLVAKAFVEATNAKNAEKAGKPDAEIKAFKDKKSEYLGQAMSKQPKAFRVDQPKGKSGRDEDNYPGITYVPKRAGGKFHVNVRQIPSNVPGAEKIPKDKKKESRTAGPADDGESIYDTMTTKAPAKEGDLARTIWTSVKTRTKGLFDLEGARPHEFMYQLFTTMDAQLEKSNLIKAPYPEAWFGTDTVDRLITDPARLGETVETQYYEQKLEEYIGALETRYIKNYLVPSVLLTETQKGRIKYSKNPEKLKMAFMERLAKDAASPQLVTTNYILRPYAMTVAIMRGVLQIPILDRASFVAQQIDEDMRTDIRRHMFHNEIKPILPRDHPMYEPLPLTDAELAAKAEAAEEAKAEAAAGVTI